MIQNIRYTNDLAVVTICDDKDLILHLVDASKDLIANKFKGRVIFDTFIRNGFYPNRFISTIFKGDKFDGHSFTDALPEHIHAIVDDQNEFLRARTNLVALSILNAKEVCMLHNWNYIS